ncbi:MAG: 6-hydroxynicotinate reductase, partial [Cypionkella sp.]|nr:6-hydroxynicotinate reductase [Cypionkella sp.]
MKDAVSPEKIRCDACPVMCYIADGRAGACDRYANHAGVLVRWDPLAVLKVGAVAVPFLEGQPDDWDGDVIKGNRPFITAVGVGTTYPDYRP